MNVETTDCLLVIDVQNDFCPGGALAVADGDRVVPVINDLFDKFDHIVLTQDWHPPGHSSFASTHPGKQPLEIIPMSYGPQVLWPDHCIQDTPGSAFHGDLHTARAQLIVRKGFRHAVDSYSAFFENDQTTPTGLTGYLRGLSVERVFLTGLATDFCVAYSALDARKQGFEVVLIEDACRGIDFQGSLEKARADMSSAGVNFMHL